MNVFLSIICDELSEDDLQKLTFEMCNTLNKETDTTASIVEQAGEAGHRGDAITIGQLALTALTSGTVVAMFNVIKTYIGQRPSLEIKLKLPGGKDITIKSQHLQGDQFDQLVKMIKKSLGG
jgi:hypothetical protein